MRNTFQQYFEDVRNTYLQGDYTEGTLRTPFENFIKNLGENFRLTQEPKRVQKLGAPDFKASRKSVKVGYIETKDLGKNLDNELESEQIKKYKEGINNLILTNYRRFILIRNNQKIFDFNLFNLSDLDNSKFTISDDKLDTFLNFINEFFDYKLPTITSAEELARELSKKAKLLKDLAKEQLEEDLQRVKNGKQPSSIYDFYEGIKELIKDISIDDCADAYAQTITYGLFLARRYCPHLERRTAPSYIPGKVGVIKRIFMNISGDAFPSDISWIVDDVIDILNASNVKNILSQIDKRGKKDKDPFIFFYEDFLNLYEPEKRKHLGIYYTPRPVVNFIVNSINQILKRDFDKVKGFAEDDVHVLDPAIGTGTFFWIAFLLTLQELKNAGLRGLIKEKIENHLLKHFYGFEILITPYVISHLKLTDLLERWFYKFKDKDRIQVYLTNTLEPSEMHGLLPFLREITEESRIANQIKLKNPILVIMGNPPYSVSSSNKSEWILEKMKDYKKDLDEKNIQPLGDDYIKFIRFAQWKIDQNGQGVVGLITNNSYLDGIIHRQMRKELLNAFDRIYILNLHGSSRREEKLPPDLSRDENVFDIQQGVAIALFVKNDKFKDKRVFYADLYGKREDKYLWLDRNRINTVEWEELKPETPCYFFTTKDLTKIKTYEKFPSLKEIFKNFNMGVATGKDSDYVSFNKEKLENKFPKKNLIIKYNYRPFDIRSVYYDTEKIQRARKKIMGHLEKENLALVSSRFLSMGSFQHQFVTDIVSDRCLVSSRTKEGGYIFPLYLYNKTKKHNFTEDFVEFVEKQYPNQEIEPEEILGYIYSVLHSPMYRQDFNEFLKIDFPRIPFVEDYEKFKKLSEIGKELVNLHLMKIRLPTHVKFDVQGSNIVKSVKYKDNKIYINKEQFFEGASKEVWNFYIGGYQVLNKWLKSRKNRKLSSNEIEHFLQVIEIIKKTIGYMRKIEENFNA